MVALNTAESTLTTPALSSQWYGTIKHHAATEDRWCFGGIVHGKPEHWTAYGRGGHPSIWFGPGGSGAPRCCRYGDSQAIYGAGTREDPYRLYADLGELRAQLRADVLKMRRLYPSRHYPYKLGGCRLWPEINE